MLILGLTALMAVAALLYSSSSATGRVTSADAGDSIPFRGIEAEGEGAAAWNADAAAPEPANTGHPTSWTNCLQAGYYYTSSRDYDNIDPASVAGLHGLSPFVPINSFPLFAGALAAAGLGPADVMMRWGLQTLGDDLEGQDWSYDEVTHVETRYYTGGEFTLMLQVQAGQPPEDMVGGLMPRNTMTIDYNELNALPIENCLDDEISGVTGVGVPEDRSAGSSAATQAVAAAFLNDLAGNGIRFLFDSLQPAGQTEFSANGRLGAFFEAQTGRIEVVALPALEEQCSSLIGIFEAGNTHDWDLVWTGLSLPAGGPVKLKVVASSVNSAESGLIIVSITDNSGPKSVAVTHPATGDNTDYLELDITPGASYPFTVEYTGDARHYKLGASHDELALGQQDIRYLEEVAQDWGIMAGAGETVAIQIETESAGFANQATTVTLTVIDRGTAAVVYGPDSRALGLDAPEIFSFANGPTARDLLVQLDQLDDHIRMTKTGGNTRFYLLPCPLQGPGPEPVPSLGAPGMAAMAGALVVAYLWSRRRRSSEAGAGGR